MIRNPHNLLAQLHIIHTAIRAAVVAACEAASVEQMATVVAHEGGDTIFAVDRVSEAALLEHFAPLAAEWSCVLIAEGLGETGELVLPAGTNAADAELRIIVDPIDGTRGLMYQKRPGWILTGVAPNRGSATTLADIELALQTEIPLVKQHLSDTLWAIADMEVGGTRFNRITGEYVPFVPQPSQATTVAQGFGAIARFFPGQRSELAALDDALHERLLGAPQHGVAQAFEDQYISSGGQLYELMAGHDRWVADLRPLFQRQLRQHGRSLGLCCHAYDVCTELIARMVGVVVTDEHGAALALPLDIHADVTWLGFANAALAEAMMPVMQALLRERRLLPSLA